MKWFKHDCDMSSDLKIQSLISQHGLEGYAIWNLTLELLGREGHAGLISSELDWRSALLLSTGLDRNEATTNKLNTVLDSMAKIGLISAKNLKSNNLSIPKFKKRVDEYTKRMLRENYGETPDTIRTESEQTTDTLHVDKKRIEKIITEYIRLKGWNEKDLVRSDYARINKASQILLTRAFGDVSLVIEGMGWIDKTNLKLWSLELLSKLWADFMKNRDKGKGAMDKEL